MQTNLAHEDGVAVLWKKNLPEAFKSAEDLVLGDRGGVLFGPGGGRHEGIVEVDYASLYPNIMVKNNISQETLDCSCCPLNGQPVPGLKYHTCTRRLGLIPRVLRPLVERKRYYKRMKKERTPLQEVYEGRDTILKWLLVTAFSDTKDTATRATAASNVTRRSTRTRATFSSSRCASRSSTGSRSCTASSTPCGSVPPPRPATWARSSNTSTRSSASRSPSRARTGGSL